MLIKQLLQSYRFSGEILIHLKVIIIYLLLLHILDVYKRQVAYFAGGIKYYNEFGLLSNSDVMGTICKVCYILRVTDTTQTVINPGYNTCLLYTSRCV